MEIAYLAILGLSPLIVLGLAALVVWLFFRFLVLRWRRTRPNQILSRLFIILSAVAFIAVPLVGLKQWEHSLLFGHLPKPLEATEIEYRLEESWGIGGPGDAETGFVVYRLDDYSKKWALEQGANLGTRLADYAGAWHSTSIDYARDSDRWEASGVEGYLGKYGYSIKVDEAWLEKANQTMRLPGAAYSYGKGGSITLVDPEGGRVYFFYAG